MMDFTILRPFAGNISRQAVFLLFRNRHPDAEENIKIRRKKDGSAILYRLIWTVSSGGRAVG